MEDTAYRPGEDEETGRLDAEESGWLDSDGEEPEIFEWKDGEPYLGAWYAVPGGHDGARNGWTISPDPQRPGWCTDNGTGWYGLPKEVAEVLVIRLNLTLGELQKCPGGFLLSARLP